ncbi:MAG: hypothetical protein IJI12_01845 [Atopobiaceae bacterium]|nr:hypothetical protein [Atopobiaceae bacterium]
MALAAQDLFKAVKTQLKDPKKLAKYIKDLAEILPAAGLLLDNAKPLVDQLQQLVPENPIPTDVADAVVHAPDKLVDKKDEVVAWFEGIKSEAAAKKLVKATRQAVLENATAHMTIKDFVKQYVEKDGAAPLTAFDMPGCYVIATYRKMDFDKDYTDYTGVYVGKADNVNAGIQEAISRLGNPDVYADVKYGQNVHVFIYNCLPQDLTDKYLALFEVVDAGSSYNS